MDGARPVYRGLGRGGAAGGHPLRGAPFFSSRMRPQGPAGFKSGRLVAQFSPYRSDEGPPGPFFHAAGACDRAPHPLAARSRAGRTRPYRQRGGGRRLPRGAPPFSRGRSRRRGGACPVGGRGAAPPGPGPAAACRSGRPARSRGRRPGVRPARGPSRPARAIPPTSRAILSAGPRPRRPDRAPGRAPAGTVRGRRFSCRGLGRPPCPPPI